MSCRYLKNVIHQVDSKHEWLFLAVTFTAKLELVFLRVFILKPTGRAKVLLKSGTREFQNCSSFERSACFHVTISDVLQVSNVFNTLSLKQIFWKAKTFFKKLEYRFLVEAAKIGNTSFPFKTDLSEANVKTNRMATAKWIYHNEWSFASSYLNF